MNRAPDFHVVGAARNIDSVDGRQPGPAKRKGGTEPDQALVNNVSNTPAQ
jgi:hypothetical protein